MILQDKTDDLKEILSLYNMQDILKRVSFIERKLLDMIKEICEIIYHIKDNIDFDFSNRKKFVQNLNQILDNYYPKMDKTVRTFIFNFIISDGKDCRTTLLNLIKEKPNVFWKVFRNNLN